MQVKFSGHHVDITPALKAFAEEKIAKLERHFEKITSIDIVFNVEKLLHIVEATVLITKAKICAHAEAKDMYTAIDEVVHKLDQQLIKHKEKISNHRD